MFDDPWRVLTVKPDGSIRLAPRVLSHALVGAVVPFLDVVDGQLHVRLIGRGVHGVFGSVLATFMDHVAVFPRPVIERRGMCFGEAL